MFEIVFTDIVHNADVSTDIYTDLLEDSAPRIISELSLFKWNTRPYPPVRNTQGGRPMEGMTDSIISGSQDYLQNAVGKQFTCDAGLCSPELEHVIRREVLRDRFMGYKSSREVKDPLLLPKQVNVCDAEISLDQLRSEGLRQWNMDMDTEYQYETFTGLPVDYGGDMSDSEEFVPDAPDALERTMRTQRLPEGGDNWSVNMVNMTPMCRIMLCVGLCRRGHGVNRMNSVTRQEQIPRN